jgi:hypothetical protein
MSRISDNRRETAAISFKVDVSRLPESGLSVRMDASPDELAALARGHGIDQAKSLHAEFKLTRWKMDGVRARGFVDANIVQQCVVTLEPLDQRVRENIDVIFLPEDVDVTRNIPGQGQELQIDFEGEDAPETFRGNKIDLGTLAEEFFELGIDPYPRKPGAEIPGADEGDGGEEKASSPFAALGKLKLGEKR